MKLFQRDQQSTIFVAVHKGASTFLAADFAAAVEQEMQSLRVVRVGSRLARGEDYEDMPLRPANDFFVRVYPNDLPNLACASATADPLANVRHPILYRDPRDAAVSMYYSQAFSHPILECEADQRLAVRRELTQMHVADGVAQVSGSVIREFLDVQRLQQTLPNALPLSYEELVGDYAAWLEKLRQHLGWRRGPTRRIYAATKGSFDVPDVEDRNVHKRRIKPGNWRDVFDDRLVELFESSCGPEMRTAGYHW